MQIAVFKNYRIPNLCKNSSVFLTLLVVVTITLILALLRLGSFSFEYFSLAAMYLIWLFLGSLSILCIARQRINQLPPAIAVLVSLLIFMLMFTMVEIASYWLFGSNIDFDDYLWRRALAALCVGLFVVSFFSILHTLDRGAKSESQSRLQALQSRIRPHFLFNSLNTIAELVSFEPEKAEQAIQSLSTLFRASLDDANNQHTLEQELSLCREYLNLEKWRLGDRLEYQESISLKNTKSFYVPKLILQPLIENAIIHGVSLMDSGGKVMLDIRETRSHLSVRVSNSKPEIEAPLGEQQESGFGLAVENIRERLFVLYDDDYYFKSRDDNDEYAVVMRLPKKIHSGT